MVEELPAEFECGVYFGWAMVAAGAVHQMVMSVGWNPFYKNTKKTMEIHILYNYEQDFYGSLMRICVTGYIRPERSFNSVEALISEINADIRKAENQLSSTEQVAFSRNHFFIETNREETNGTV